MSNAHLLETPDIQTAVGQIYGDSRFKNGHGFQRRYEVVYCDEQRVLLRNLGDGTDYHFEPRDTFDRYRGSRYKLIHQNPEAEAEQLRSVPDFEAVYALLHSLKEQYLKAPSRKDTHKAEAVDELHDLIETRLEPDTADWTAVSGIGDQTAQNLHDSGIETPVDVAATPAEQLEAIDGLGETTAQRLRAFATDELEG